MPWVRTKSRGPAALSALIFLIALSACNGSAIEGPLRECDEETPCSNGLICIEGAFRCSTESTDVERFYLSIKFPESEIPRIHAQMLTVDELQSQRVTLNLPEPTRVNGRLLNTNDSSSQTVTGTISITSREFDDGISPRITLRALGSSPTFAADLSPGSSYRLVGQADLLARSPTEKVVLVEESGSLDLDLVVPAFPYKESLVLITAHLVSSSGDPITDTQISIQDSLGRRVSGINRSNSEGKASLELRLDATPPLFAQIQDIPGVPGASIQIPIEPDMQQGGDMSQLEIPLEEPAQARIQVKTDAEESIPNAIVHTMRIGAGLEQMIRAPTDDEGQVTLDLHPGLHLVVALPPPGHKYGLVTRSLWLTPGLKEKLVLECPRRQTLSGKILHPDLTPLSGVRIYDNAPIQLLEGVRIHRGSSGFTSLEGDFSLSVGRGEHTLEFRQYAPFQFPPSIGKVVVENATLTVEKNLEWPFLRVFEVLDHTGAPIENAIVRIAWSNAIAPEHSLYVDGQTNEFGEVALPLPSSRSVDEQGSSTPGFVRSEKSPSITSEDDNTL